jgi:RNA polymerase sigma factor (sigma-70 family)
MTIGHIMKIGSEFKPEPPTKKGSSIFATTEWTRILAARGTSPEARTALSELCERYYAPVLHFLRCTGYPEERARESAHDFFAALLEHSGLDELERGQGRFRSYLLGALKHSLCDVAKRNGATKRSGDREHVSLEGTAVGDLGIDARGAPPRSPEQEFDRKWALAVLDHALTRFADECTRAGKEEEFDLIKPWLTGDDRSFRQASVSASLGVSEGAVKVAIHRLRKRLRHIVKEEIAQTLSDPANVDQELQCLLAALRT